MTLKDDAFYENSGNGLGTDCRFKRTLENQAAGFVSWRSKPGYQLFEIWCTDVTK